MSQRSLRGMTRSPGPATGATSGHVQGAAGSVDSRAGAAFFRAAGFGSTTYFVHERRAGEFGVSLFNDCFFAEDEPPFQGARFNGSHFNDCRFQ